MLHLILGQSGTGKTTRVLEQVKQNAAAGKNALLIVPEHASFETERRVCTELPAELAQRVDVFSFPRLAENIFRDCGGLSHRALDDMSRVVIMRMAVSEVQDSLRVYRRQVGYSGFLTTLLDTVQEWKRAGVTAGQLESLTESREENPLTEKLRDLGLIYTAYQAIVERSFHDPLDELALASQLAGEKGWFQDREIWLDGFDYFSVGERQMIETMLSGAAEITFSMTANALDSREDIFVFQKKFLHRLLQTAAQCGVSVARPLVLEEALRFHNDDLTLLQAAFTDHSVTGKVTSEAIHVIRAKDTYDEVQCAAAEILRLVREGGFRFQDIAILCRDSDRYESARALLQGYGIPVFCSEKDRLLSHALPLFLTTALDCACGTLHTEGLLRLARSAASGLTPEAAGNLENYCFVWSVKGQAWLAAFSNNPEGMSDLPPEGYAEAVKKIEESRRTLIEPLSRLRERLRRCTGGEFAAALYDYIRNTNALQNLSHGCSREQKELLDREWNCIVDILDLFTDFFDQSMREGAEFLELFTLALSRIDLANVPNTVDHVSFSEVDRVRLQSPCAVFVLGVNEGLFPACGGDTGLFSTREREELIANGVEIPVSGVENALREQYVLYTALSSPAQRLYISYSGATLQGDAVMVPSVLLMKLIHRLGIAVRDSSSLSPTDFVVNLDTAKTQWAKHLGENTSVTASLEVLLRESREDSFIDTLTAVAQDAPAEDISPATAKALLGHEITLSPTAIDRFFQCPYQYFCDKMLRLRPRQKVEYSPFESGSAIHYVFEQMINRHGSKGLILLTAEEREREIEEFLMEYISRMVPDKDAVTARFRYQFLRLKLMLCIILRHMAEELAQSDFVTAETEVKVGKEGKVIPPALQTEDGTPIQLIGSIDRVDLYHSGEKDYLRVIDYKSGEKDFRLEEVYYGLNMQMLIYLYAACDDQTRHFGQVEPAGILYAPSKIQAVETAADATEETLGNKVNTDLRMKGLVLEDEAVLRAMERDLAGVYIPAGLTGKGTFSKTSKLQSREEFSKLRELVYGNITEMSNQLSSGKIGPLPVKNGKHSPCDYCKYAALCNNSGPGGRCREMEKSGEEEEE